MRAMRFLADKNFAAASLDLRVALQAEVTITLDEHLRIDGTVWLMAGRATVAHGLVLECVRTSLFAVTVGASFVETRHCQTSRRLHDVKAVRVMTLGAIHVSFRQWMMVRQVELSLCLQMARITGSGVAPGIENELPAPSPNSHVPAAGAMARLAAGLASTRNRLKMHASMRAAGKSAHVICVAFVACFVANEGRALDFGRSENRPLHGGTRRKHKAAGDECAKNQYGKEPGHGSEHLVCKCKPQIRRKRFSDDDKTLCSRKFIRLNTLTNSLKVTTEMS